MVQHGSLLQNNQEICVNNRYTIKQYIASGTCAEIYQTHDAYTGATRALKILRPEFLASPTMIERFERECSLLCMVRHPNIVRAFSCGTFEARPFLVMECLEGKTLAKWTEEGCTFEPAQALDIVRQIAQALQALCANSCLYAHRDIKPQNIMLEPAGKAKLLDFGIAKTTLLFRTAITTQFVGSLHYMSPEQIENAAQVDVRSDLYSLGAVFYEMLTGKKAFDGPNNKSVIDAHYIAKRPCVCESQLFFPAEASSLTRKRLTSVCNAVLKMLLAARKENRFQTPQELLAFLNANAPAYLRHLAA